MTQNKRILISVQGKISLVLDHGFCSFILRNLRPLPKVNAPKSWLIFEWLPLTVALQD